MTLKNQILTESVKILGQSGFEGLSLREVAKKLKVTHQAPYHYFPDKNALLMELKKMGFQQLKRAMENAVKISDTQTLNKNLAATEIIEKIGMTYFDYCTENPGFFRAMFAADAGGQGIRVEEAQQAFQCLKDAILFLQESGKIKKIDAEIMAMICWTYMHGYVSLIQEKYPVMGGKFSYRDLALKMVQGMSALLLINED